MLKEKTAAEKLQASFRRRTGNDTTSEEAERLLPTDSQGRQESTLTEPTPLITICRAISFLGLGYLAFSLAKVTTTSKNFFETELELQIAIACVFLGSSDFILMIAFWMPRLQRFGLFIRSIGFPWLFLSLAALMEECTDKKQNFSLVYHLGLTLISFYSLREVFGLFVYFTANENSSTLRSFTRSSIFVGDTAREASEAFGALLLVTLFLCTIISANVLLMTTASLMVFNFFSGLFKNKLGVFKTSLQDVKEIEKLIWIFCLKDAFLGCAR